VVSCSSARERLAELLAAAVRVERRWEATDAVTLLLSLKTIRRHNLEGGHVKVLPKNSSDSLRRRIALCLLGVGTLAGASANVHAQTFNINEFTWDNHTVLAVTQSPTTGNCPPSNPLPPGMACTSTLTYSTPDGAFQIVATYYAVNKGIGAVVTVTATVTNKTGFAGSVGVGPALNFQLNGTQAPISAVGSLSGSCIGVEPGSYIDDGLSIGNSYTTGQIDAPCPVFLPTVTAAPNYISHLSFDTPPGPYKAWSAILLYNPQVLTAFAPNSIVNSIESFEVITKLGPASFLVPYQKKNA
jgi:hypothetical protein